MQAANNVYFSSPVELAEIGDRVQDETNDFIYSFVDVRGEAEVKEDNTNHNKFEFSSEIVGLEGDRKRSKENQEIQEVALQVELKEDLYRKLRH